MRNCGRDYGCREHYLNYDGKVYNSSLPQSSKNSAVNTYTPYVLLGLTTCISSMTKDGMLRYNYHD